MSGWRMRSKGGRKREIKSVRGRRDGWAISGASPCIHTIAGNAHMTCDMWHTVSGLTVHVFIDSQVMTWPVTTTILWAGYFVSVTGALWFDNYAHASFQTQYLETGPKHWRSHCQKPQSASRLLRYRLLLCPELPCTARHKPGTLSREVQRQEREADTLIYWLNWMRG
jgi:hypothetical protein